MHPRLLDDYTRELRYMRALASEFADAHPKIARRLGMQSGEIADPYVQRLIESASFINARTQAKLDDEFPQLTQALLAGIYPNYLAPTPAIGVARFLPGGKAGDLVAGHCIPRGTLTDSHLPEGEKTVCTFRTTSDVTLYPLTITHGVLTGVPPDIPGLDRHVPPHRRVRGALRLRLRTADNIPFSRLRNLDRLPVYLAGDEKIASHLHELIHTASVASIVGEPGRFSETGYRFHVVTSGAVIQEGLGTEEAVLPLASPQFLGHNLVHEYFACPSRFYCFTLTGLSAALRHIDGCEAEIAVLLDRATSEIADRVDAAMFALFCTPVVNLFSLRTESAEIDADAREIPLVPVQKFPLDYEIHSVDAALGQSSEASEPLVFHPFYSALMNDEDAGGRYFVLRREQLQSAAKARRYSTHMPYVTTAAHLSFVATNGEPYRREDEEPVRFLALDVWLTNRELPGLLRCNGASDLALRESGPVTGVGFVRPPMRSQKIKNRKIAESCRRIRSLPHSLIGWSVNRGASVFSRSCDASTPIQPLIPSARRCCRAPNLFALARNPA